MSRRNTNIWAALENDSDDEPAPVIKVKAKAFVNPGKPYVNPGKPYVNKGLKTPQTQQAQQAQSQSQSQPQPQQAPTHPPSLFPTLGDELWGDSQEQRREFELAYRARVPPPLPPSPPSPPPQSPSPSPSEKEDEVLQTWIDEHGWNDTPSSLRKWMRHYHYETVEQIPTLEEATNFVLAHTNEYLAKSACSEQELWTQPFTQNLSEHASDHFNTSKMSDEDYHAFMTWLLSEGWRVEEPVSRTYVRAEPDSLPSRPWRHIIPPQPRVQRADCTFPVARFCRKGRDCLEDTCRFVHGDTIARQNVPCHFGQYCGESDPTGLKRAQCLRMHPGETWTARSVITRPVAK